MGIVDRVFDIVSHWSPIGQGFFLVLALIIFVIMPVGLIIALAKYVVVLFRGWPPPGSDSDNAIGTKAGTKDANGITMTMMS